MFRAAVENLIDTEGLSFIPYTNDTQSLNTVALKNQIDVTAVSVAFYPFISENKEQDWLSKRSDGIYKHKEEILFGENKTN